MCGTCLCGLLRDIEFAVGVSISISHHPRPYIMLNIGRWCSKPISQDKGALCSIPMVYALLQSIPFRFFLQLGPHAVGMMPVDNYWKYDGDGVSFFLQWGMCTIYCVRTNDHLLFTRDVVVENLLAHAVVKLY